MRTAALMMCVVLGLVACGKGESAGQPQTLEYKVAVISANRPVAADDTSVDRAKALLLKASERYQLPPEKIADIAAVVRNEMEKAGADFNMLDFLDGMLILGAVDQRQVKNDFASNAAQYATMRRGTGDHQGAIRALVVLQTTFIRLQADPN